MATSSFFRDIEIKTPKQARKLIKALEQSEKERDRAAVLRYPVFEVKREHVKDLLAKIKW